MLELTSLSHLKKHSISAFLSPNILKVLDKFTLGQFALSVLQSKILG